MANLTSLLTVRMIDAVTAPARAAANSIRGVGAAVDSTNTRRLAIGGAVQTMVRDVDTATKRIRKNLQTMTTGLSMPTGLMTFFGARSVYNFEKISNKLEAVTGMTGEQKKQIQGYAKELNELFPFTNEQIMGAAFELGRAGFKFEQIIGSLKDTLNLSLAGDIEIQEASDIATNILTAMRLPVKTADQARESLQRVNDALAYVAANSNTDVRKMGETFKYVGPIAASSGLDIEEVAAASMVMAQSGIKASEAGVAMRSALVRMLRPTKPMIASLERLNVNIDDFIKRGRQISSSDIIGSLAADGIDAANYASQIDAALKNPTLNKSLSKLTAHLSGIIGKDASIVDKAALASTISDALTAAGAEVDFFGFLQALREKGADIGDVVRIFDARQGSRLETLLKGDLAGTLERLIKEAQGSTDKMSRTMMQGIVGDWAALVASVENLFIAIAESGVLKTATEAIKSLTNGLKSLAESSPRLLEWGTYALLFAGTLGPIAIVGGGVLAFFLSLVSLMRTAIALGGGALGVAGAAMGISGAVAGATGAGTAAAGALAGAASKGSSLLGKAAKGAGIIGTAWTVKEVLDAVDPEGNLWGLTSGIDAWIESKTGINPSKVGGSERIGPEATAEQARAADLTDILARQAAVDKRLSEIEANTHPAMRDMPNPERENLQYQRTMLDADARALAPQAQPAEAAAAAKQTMDGYNAVLATELTAAEAQVDAFMARIAAKMATTLSPVVSPRLDMSAISGVHADTGVD
ncbi:TP901 family phage tail tape measure protein [Ochrobactrum sp. BH3]|nr:TP901 family phage tail tape measure protein [Ochrobactrum sp. BH3]